MKYLLMIISLIFCTRVIGQHDTMLTTSTVKSRPTYTTKETEYIGEGTLDEFITKNINSDARKYINKNCLNNKYFAMMRIDPKGNVTNVQITEGDDIVVNHEIIRVLKLTKWNPAMVNGRPINRKILVPFTFLY